ncbi:3711_t:CDS:1, partial [Ambispora gerdemannii]
EGNEKPQKTIYHMEYIAKIVSERRENKDFLENELENFVESVNELSEDEEKKNLIEPSKKRDENQKSLTNKNIEPIYLVPYTPHLNP